MAARQRRRRLAAVRHVTMGPVSAVKARDSRRSVDSPRSVALVAAALAVSLTLATGFLLVQHLRPSASSVDHPAHPLTDSQTMAQVIEPTKEIVAVAGLQGVTGGYTLMSCRDVHDPPYQGAVYVNFRLLAGSKTDALAYLQKIGAALVADGWAEGLPPNQHLFGHTLEKNGVTAILYETPDQPNFGTLQVYGECRDTTDHAGDRTAWTDVTEQLG
jgi:hypothetical protein